MMNILHNITSFFRRLFGKGKGISIIVPFKSSNTTDHRTKNLEWLKKYWKYHLPAAEIIVGADPNTDLVFSKSAAVNNAAKKAKGDIFVIIDADCYLQSDVILYAAQEIRKAKKTNRKLWFIPYRHFYRMNQDATEILLTSSAKKPYTFNNPPNDKDVLDIKKTDANPASAHWFGAGVQILPREAFETTKGWDARFRGWGGEDRAAMEATDTLYWPHKTIRSQCLHMWHPMFGMSGSDEWISWKERVWENQKAPSSNGYLSRAYSKAVGNRILMQEIVDDKIIAELIEELERERKHHRKRHKRHNRHHHQPSI